MSESEAKIPDQLPPRILAIETSQLIEDSADILDAMFLLKLRCKAQLSPEIYISSVSKDSFKIEMIGAKVFVNPAEEDPAKKIRVLRDPKAYGRMEVWGHFRQIEISCQIGRFGNHVGSFRGCRRGTVFSMEHREIFRHLINFVHVLYG